MFSQKIARKNETEVVNKKGKKKNLINMDVYPNALNV